MFKMVARWCAGTTNCISRSLSFKNLSIFVEVKLWPLNDFAYLFSPD